MSFVASAIVLAAGAGRRMGQDKALLELDGELAITRALRVLFEGGIASAVVVRAEGAAALPDRVLADPRVRIAKLPAGREMIESLRAGVAALPGTSECVVVLPVDHALVSPATVAALLGKLATSDAAQIAVPVRDGRAGHPIALRTACLREVETAPTLRECVRRDPGRVAAIAVQDPFVTLDLDTPEDLRRARALLRTSPRTTLEIMRAHRSRRSYSDSAVAPELLAELVDAARFASTSSGMQAYAIVAVTEASSREAIAALCADQAHVREAPVFLAICADLHKIGEACRRSGHTMRAEGLELFLQTTIDAALVAQNLALAAESLGLGVCMIGAARNHPVALARHLGLPRHCYVAFGMTLGVAKDDPVPRGRMDLAGVLHRGTYDTGSIESALTSMDETMRAWARATNRECGGYQGRLVDETRGWCERMAKLWGKDDGAKSRGGLLAELRELGFLAS